MSMSTSVGRQGLARALVRSLKHSNSMSQGQRTVSSASVSFRNSQHRLYSRTAQVGGAWWTVRRPHLGEKRWISAGGVKGDDSDDDFKPKRKVVSDNPDDVADLIKNQVESNPVMVYMKGTPSEPQCGFSARVVRILHVQGVSFSSVNVLDYPAIREGVKTYTDWPTVPQVFVNGEFVGGSDIMMQMQESGELEALLKEAKLRD
ncbi:unnamed protein product [Ascophyllum nodosum]